MECTRQVKLADSNQWIVRPSQLMELLSTQPSTVKVLSLDCFDTLLWRQSATPSDVFYELAALPEFKRVGLSASLRQQAEASARSLAKVVHDTQEVSLATIYAEALPNESEATRLALIELELALENRILYAFPPMLTFLNAALAQGLKVIIVSDTYFSEAQLRGFLRQHLPKETYENLHQVFCSSHYGRSKSAGLFQTVLAELKVKGDAVLHCGDNAIADVVGAKAFGLRTAHFVQENVEMQEINRMYALASHYIDPAFRNHKPLYHPYRAQLATYLTPQTDLGTFIGYGVLGPILFPFAQFILETIALAPKTKVAFLLRDGYLPAKLVESLAGEAIGACVRISRFAGFAASFRSKADIDSYLADRLGSGRFEDMAKQLLLPEKLINQVKEKTKNKAQAEKNFVQFIHQPRILETIISASTHYRKRLMRYLQRELALEPNDTLLLVDLGYTGTVQNRLTTVFQEEFNITIEACYFLSLQTPHNIGKRTGLLDERQFDESTRRMLVSYIALLEQVCTSLDKSVVDYTEEGEPIYEAVQFKELQFSRLHTVQQACIQFVNDAKTLAYPSEKLAECSAIHLARWLFLPTQQELNYFSVFQFDFNLGTQELLPLFDANLGLTALKRRSLLFSAKTTLSHLRTNFAAEWRSASLELAVFLMAQHRFGFEVARQDLSHRREQVGVSIMANGEKTRYELQALHTQDGYFALIVPVTGVPTAIELGANYQWVELESAELIELKALHTQRELDHTQDASANLYLDKMTDHGGGLFSCNAVDSVVFFSETTKSAAQRVLRIIFRPIVLRTAIDSVPASA